jgi:zinc protease
LTVIVAPVHAAPVATVGVLYKAGSRDETPWTTGVAHQVEHMMFKGTTDLLKPGDIDRRFYDNQATTDQDSTYYYESFHKDELGSALEVEADRMLNAAIDSAQLRAENAVVLAELESADNSPAELLDEQVGAAAMQAHQYHWPTIGWKSVVATFAARRDLVYDFYTRHYAPQNAVLVIAGDVDADAAMALVHRYFDGVAQRPVAPLERIVEPRQAGVRRFNISGAGSSDRIEMAYHVPGEFGEDGYVLQVLDAVLGTGQSSRLYQSLVGGGYATDLTTTPNQTVDPFVYTISATLADGVSHDSARAVVERELRDLADAPVSDAELRKGKKQVIASYVYSHDGIEALAQSLARWQAWTGDWRNDARFAARIEAVSAAQIRQFARRYLVSDNLTLGTYTARSAAAPVPHTRAHGHRMRARERVAPFAPARLGSRAIAAATAVESSPAGPQRFVLTNGMILIVQENHANPSAVIETSTQAGSAFDPPSAAGLAALTQEMLMRGTTNRPYDKLQSAFDSLALTVNAAISLSDATFSTQMLSADEPKAMALLADILMHPAFDPVDFSQAKEQLIADRRSDRDDPAVVARDALFRMLYPASNPWSRPSVGTPDGLARVYLRDAVGDYRAHYGPNDTVVVVTGDVDADAIRAQVAGVFGNWRRIKSQAIELRGPAAQVAKRIDATVPSAAQVELYAGAPGLPQGATDYDAAQLMNFALGGGSFISKLLHQVRDVDGYVYNIETRFADSAAGGGPWIMTFGANRRDVDKALAESIGQMRTLQRDGVSDAELADYRRLAADAVITGELSDQGLADELLRDELLGLGLDHAQRLPQIYGAIAPAQIQAAAQKYLHPDALTVSTAGPP